MKNGKIDWSVTALVPHTDGNWYYVDHAWINWNYTGLAKATNGGIFYVKNGSYNTGYTGTVSYTHLYCGDRCRV